MPPFDVEVLHHLWPVLLLDACTQRKDSAGNRSCGAVPVYIVAVSAEPASLKRARGMLFHYGACPVYHVDRQADTSAAAAVRRVEVLFANVTQVKRPRHWIQRGDRDAESTYSHLSAWAHLSRIHTAAHLAIFAEEDLEMWVPPSGLCHALVAFASSAVQATVVSCMLGGCWGNAQRQPGPCSLWLSGASSLRGAIRARPCCCCP